MSQTGDANKLFGDFRRSVMSIAAQGLTDRDGLIPGTKKTVGYVCAIHEDGELAGTIDVQEFNYEPGEYSTKGAGHHAGVLLSAIQNNADGIYVVPMMYSEVVIVQNPADLQEYVILYSQARHIHLHAQSLQGKNDGKIEVGVTEVEDFNETDDGLEKDYNELEPTKNKSLTTYTSTSITDQVSSKDDEDGFKQEITAEHKTLSVGDTKITIDGQNIKIETSNKMSLTIGSTKIAYEDGKVNIESDNCTVKGSKVTITGGTLEVKGSADPTTPGPFNAIPTCPFSGAPHCGKTVSGT